MFYSQICENANLTEIISNYPIELAYCLAIKPLMLMSDLGDFRFSQQLIKKIESIKQKHYIPKIAKVRFIIYWKKEKEEYEIRIILPELYFERPKI